MTTAIDTSYEAIAVHSVRNGWVVLPYPRAFHEHLPFSEAHVYVSPEVLGAAVEDWARERRNRRPK